MSNHVNLEHLLVATDFSAQAEAALRRALWLAENLNARITLAHVAPDYRQILMSASLTAWRELAFSRGRRTFNDSFHEEIYSRMKGLIARNCNKDLPVDCKILSGDPVTEIIRHVQQERHDLLLIGKRGRTPGGERLLGNTAKRLIHKCPSPVWANNGECPTVPKEILIATDFSETSRSAMLLGHHISRIAGAAMHLVHVIDNRELPERAVDRLAAGTSLHEKVKAAAESRTAELVREVGGESRKLQSHVVWGDAPQEVLRLSKTLKNDLLVLGTVGRRGPKQVVLGSTAEHVLNGCNTSVLAVKHPEFKTFIEPPLRFAYEPPSSIPPSHEAATQLSHSEAASNLSHEGAAHMMNDNVP